MSVKMRAVGERLQSLRWAFRKWNLLFSLAVRRKLTSPPPPDRWPNVLIVSPGGVATTMLIEHIGQFTVTNLPGDSDGLKHLPRPPRWASEIEKVIFVYGDRSEVYLSIKRRGWVGKQGAKLGSLLAATFPGAIARLAFITAVGKQIESWNHWCSLHPERRLFLTYDEIWQSCEKIGDFCGIEDKNFVETFPRRENRTISLLNRK